MSQEYITPALMEDLNNPQLKEWLSIYPIYETKFRIHQASPFDGGRTYYFCSVIYESSYGIESHDIDYPCYIQLRADYEMLIKHGLSTILDIAISATRRNDNFELHPMPLP